MGKKKRERQKLACSRGILANTWFFTGKSQLNILGETKECQRQMRENRPRGEINRRGLGRREEILESAAQKYELKLDTLFPGLKSVFCFLIASTEYNSKMCLLDTLPYKTVEVLLLYFSQWAQASEPLTLLPQPVSHFVSFWCLCMCHIPLAMEISPSVLHCSMPLTFSRWWLYIFF